MKKARRIASCYVALWMLGCTYCGKEITPAPPALLAQADLRADACGSCGAQAFCNSLGACVPNAWVCGPMYYNGGADDGCDCNCGAPDPDCQRPGAQTWCYLAGQTYAVDQCGECGAEAPSVEPEE